MKSVGRIRRKGKMAKKNEHFEKEHWNCILKTGGKNLGHQQKFYWRSEKDEKRLLFFPKRIKASILLKVSCCIFSKVSEHFVKLKWFI